LNDVLDVRHDSAFSPERPIPAGRIKVGQAIIVTVSALIVAVIAGAAWRSP
jgi:4-hydroxybenzoate polyprenyltransferase